MAKDAKAALLLALSPSKGGGGPMPEDKGDGGGDYSSARDVLDAIHDNDEGALKMALRTFVMDCMKDGDEESEPESER